VGAVVRRESAQQKEVVLDITEQKPGNRRIEPGMMLERQLGTIRTDSRETGG
jgi:hypothetical protein